MSTAEPRSGEHRLLSAFRQPGEPLTLAEITRRSDLHENGARRILARLERDGRIVAEPGRPRGSRGRPAIRYRAVAPPEAPFRELLPLLLALIEDEAPTADNGRMRVYELGRSQGLKWESDADAAEAIAAAFTALGFAPRTTAGDNRGRIGMKLTACPFADVVGTRGGAALCALHHGMAAGIAERRGGRIESFEIVDPRSDSCRLTVIAGAETQGRQGRLRQPL